jgi:soluble lytic murein transglycosylase-like protein
LSNVLQEYLVKLSWAVEDPELQRLNSLMARAEVAVSSRATGMARTMLETQGAIVGAFTGISGAILGVMSNAAGMDQQWRLSGEKMMVSTKSARDLDLITKTLGADLGQIWRDPELHGRVPQLKSFIDRVFGPPNDPRLKQVRDMQIAIKELTGPGLMALGQKFTISLMEQLFPGQDPLAKLQGWVTYFEDHIGEISDKLATRAVPILKDTWHIMLGLGEAAKAGALAFTNIVGLFSGDTSIEGSKFSFEKLATAIEHCTNLLYKMVTAFKDAELTVAHSTSALALLLRGDVKDAAKEANVAVHGEFKVNPKTGKTETEGGIGWGSGAVLSIGAYELGKVLWGAGRSVAGGVGWLGRMMGMGGGASAAAATETAAATSTTATAATAAAVAAAAGATAIAAKIGVLGSAGGTAGATLGSTATAAEIGITGSEIAGASATGISGTLLAPLTAIAALLGVAFNVGGSAGWIARRLTPAQKRGEPDEQATKAEIIAAAKGFGVPPSLALAVASQESGFRQDALSKKGAIGVMQLMGPTAKNLGVNPNIASENIEGGVHYLANLLKWYEGDQSKAVAAYNAGVRRVDSGKALPPETQAYVPSVLAKAQAYLRNQSAGIAASGAGGPAQQDVHVNVGGVYITQPGATPEQIQRCIEGGICDALDNRERNVLAQLQPAY